MIVCFSNQKGGVGKTTSTINIGSFLSELGLKILLIDFDPQGNLSSGLGFVSQKKTIYNALVKSDTIHSLIQTTEQKNLFIIPANSDLSGASVELINIPQREAILKNTLNSIKEKFDMIFIDCPPSLGILTLNALCASQKVIIPLQCEFYALEGVVKLVQTINLVKKTYNSTLGILGIILTMFDSRTNLSIEVVKEIKKIFQKSVFETIIPRNVRIAEAPSYGKSIFLYDTQSSGYKSYLQLSKEVLLRWKKEKKD